MGGSTMAESLLVCESLAYIWSTALLPYSNRAGLDQPFSPALLWFNPPACELLISRLPQDETLSWAEKKSFLVPKDIHYAFLCMN